MKKIAEIFKYVALVSFLSYSKVLACAGSYSEIYVENEHYNFLDASMVHLDEKNPLYKLSGSYGAHEERFKYFNQKKEHLNINAWYNYFQKKISKEEIKSLFYKKNSIAQSAIKYKNSTAFPHFATYISFLNKQNHLAQNEQSSIQLSSLIQEGKRLLKKEEQPFLKERYFYLLLRLQHHAEHYQEMLTFYEKFKNIIEKNSIVSEWIDALRAGAYKHLKKRIKANQLYAKIFKNNKTNAHYGYYDFEIESNEEWNALLQSSSTKEEKSLYYFLRAMQWENEPLYELESIAKIAPNSIWFERLSYMIMHNFQNQRYSIMQHSGKKDKYFKSQIKSYKLQKKKFLEILKNIKNPTFFMLYSKLYLKNLDYESLKKSEIKKLENLATASLTPYVTLLKYLIKLHVLNDINEVSQKNLFQNLPEVLAKLDRKRQTSLLRYTALQLSTLYPKESVEATFAKLYAEKKYLSRLDILFAINENNASAVQMYIEKKNRSFIENKIFKANMKVLHRNDIAKILTILYLKENTFKKAKFYLRQVPRENISTLYNPFNATLNGTNRTLSKKSYSQRTFIETMLRLEDALKKKPNSAIDHFLYANGLYNKSWFGNFPLSATLYRSTSIYKGDKPSTANLDKAKKHYLEALKYAKKENFKAKIAYQLLKIEFNQVISNTEEYDDDLWTMPTFGGWNNGTKNIIKLLKNSKKFKNQIEDYRLEYRHTKYGQEVIKKCITFKYF